MTPNPSLHRNRYNGLRPLPRSAEMMDSNTPLQPGENPIDPYVKDIDPVAFALERVWSKLAWIEEHRASFEAARETDPEPAERELAYLRDTTEQARQYMTRLMELILAGYTIDPSKRLPRGLQ